MTQALTTSTPPLDGLADAFLDHVDEDRDWAATQLGLEVLDQHGVEVLVTQLLVPVQLEAGRRWQDGTYLVADEHHVTSLVDDLLSAARLRVGRPGPDALRVTLACADGEWHASAARMVSLQLQAAGVDVRFLGASAPADELERHLRERPPEALLVSCTMSASIVGAGAMIVAAHRAGVPVVVGGRAFALHTTAGPALGADAVVSCPVEVLEVLHAWREHGRPHPADTAVDERTGERAILAPARRSLAQAVLSALADGRPPTPQETVELEGLLATLDAALLLDDDTLLREHASWLRERERATGHVLPAPVGRVLDVLQRHLPPATPRSRSLLTAAAEAVRAA